MSVPAGTRFIGIQPGVDMVERKSSQANSPTEVYTIEDIQVNAVPYTGATGDVDLGEYELKAGQFELDQSPTGTAGVAVTRWNNTIGSTETTLKGGSVLLKNGVDLVARVVNKVSPNATLTKADYQVVKISGAQGQRLAVDYAQANNDNNSADTLGVVIETIPTNQEGFIMTVGQLEGINTTGSLQGESWLDGDVLYLSPTVPGAVTKVKPNGLTGHIVIIGYVEHAHVNNGKIYVKIMNGWELDELHNVYIDNGTLANNQALIYESATQLWKNKPVTETIISLSDNTTNDVSTSKHGFVPKAPNDTTKFLRGDGTWATASPIVNAFGISNTSGVYTYYATLTLAMAAATAGQTIELFADVIETGAVTITLKNGVNINGNGHTYTLDTATTTTGFIDGGVTVVMNFTNITLVRKGAGAGIMIGLSAAGNRIVGNSTLIKIESNSSAGIANYGGAVFSGYVIGFAVIGTGTSCAGISLVRGTIDNCTAIVTGSGLTVNIGFLTNSSGESTGSGNGLQISNTGGQIYNCHGRSNTGYGIYAGSPVYNSTGYSAGSFGIRFEASPLYNCVGISAANYGISGYSEIISNCTSLSTASSALFIQNAQANNCMAYSTVSSAVVMFSSSTVHNSTLRTLSGSTTVNTASLTTYGSLKNCTIINDWPSASGHGVPANSVLTVINCAIKVASTSANCLNASSPVTMKYTNNAFEGATTPVNANITQGIINTQDNQGNILI